jgi:hypothetical protein
MTAKTSAYATIENFGFAILKLRKAVLVAPQQILNRLNLKASSKLEMSGIVKGNPRNGILLTERRS